jgi:nitroreductase
LEFFTVLQRRRSVRSYKSQPIEEDKLRRIFEAANLAPSAGNLQAYHVYVFQEKSKREALARAANGQTFIEQAPVCLVFCTDPSRCEERYGARGRELYSVQDATIAGSFAMLAAVDLGLSTVWVGDFDEDAVREVVGEKTGRPVAMFSVGYAAEEPRPSGRRAIEEIFSGDFPQTD